MLLIEADHVSDEVEGKLPAEEKQRRLELLYGELREVEQEFHRKLWQYFEYVEKKLR